MLNYCCLFHKYHVSLTPYCKTTLELATTFNCLERRSPNASSTVYCVSLGYQATVQLCLRIALAKEYVITT